MMIIITPGEDNNSNTDARQHLEIKPHSPILYFPNHIMQRLFGDRAFTCLSIIKIHQLKQGAVQVYKGQHGGKRVKKFGQGPPPPFSGNARKKTFFIRDVPLF